MKKLLIPALLLAAASSYGALSPATGARMDDYTNWFAPQFDVASDANFSGVPYPRFNQPNGVDMDTVNRDWTGWSQNWGGTALAGPIVVGAIPEGFEYKFEFAFLGETAGWWNDVGYRLNGEDFSLADGIQAAGATPNREFGDYFELNLNVGDTLDFYIVGNGSTGGKYFVFDQSENEPASATMQSYYGSLIPLTGGESLDLDRLTYTVMGLEDIQLGSGADRDYNDLLFAFRSGAYIPEAPPVPEPSTYGLIGAAALLALVGYRRFKKA